MFCICFRVGIAFALVVFAFRYLLSRNQQLIPNYSNAFPLGFLPYLWSAGAAHKCLGWEQDVLRIVAVSTPFSCFCTCGGPMLYYIHITSQNR